MDACLLSCSQDEPLLRLSWPISETVIVYTGHLSKHRGIDATLDVSSRMLHGDSSLLRDCENVRLPEPDDPHFQNAIEELLDPTVLADAIATQAFQ